MKSAENGLGKGLGNGISGQGKGLGELGLGEGLGGGWKMTIVLVDRIAAVCRVYLTIVGV